MNYLSNLFGVALILIALPVLPPRHARRDSFPAILLDRPVIQDNSHPLRDPIAKLDRNLQDGKVHLKFQGAQGYLRSLLEALEIPVESQMMVFSKTSGQPSLINPRNPRTLFFNDTVTVGWVPGGFIEVASQDPVGGVVFYTLDQKPADVPTFVRRNQCLLCHVLPVTVDVPGMLVRSVYTAPDGRALPQLGSHFSDERSPFAERWGGWYVTGDLGSMQHMGNIGTESSEGMASGKVRGYVRLDWAREEDDRSTYLSPYSDVVALMIFDHQVHMTNLLIRIGSEARRPSHAAANEHAQRTRRGGAVRSSAATLRELVKEVVDCLLFVDEARLPGPVRSTSGFAEKFTSIGPYDSNHRSLRQFDLQHRLMRYPCSYMIYAPIFDALPTMARQAIYERMWQVLSGQDRSEKYRRLTATDREAVVEILRATKKDLPAYFAPMR